MALERVIQDSDDEDLEEEIPTSIDPLQQSPPEPIADGGVAIIAPGDEEAPDYANAGQLVENTSPKVTSGHDLGVNFDDFLQSQSQTGQSFVSPLQSRQQREGDAQVSGNNGQSLGGISNTQSNIWQSGPQSPLNSKLKRTQTIASLNEVEETRNNDSKKGAKRCKTMGADGSNRQSRQRLSFGEYEAHAREEGHIAEKEELKENEEANDVDMPLNGEGTRQTLKKSARRGMTQGNKETAKRQKPSRRCISTVTKEMDGSWDRDQLGFEAGATAKDTINVQITTSLTRSQEQEYGMLNGAALRNSHSRSDQEKESDEMNLIQDIPSNNRGETPIIDGRENSASVIEEHQPNEICHNLIMRDSIEILDAASPHDTEELSSFSSAHVQKKSTPSVREPPQSTPEDPFDESPPRKRVDRKPGRKRRATVVDDSDDSPDELNPPVDPPKEKEKYQSRRARSKNIAVDTDDDDDVVPPEKFDYHDIEPSRGHATRIGEEQRSLDVEDANSDEIGMPPKEQYKPRPSRSRGKPTEPAPEPPENPGKGLKKKKMKRGKTTSVTLKKSVESDVEDDVVWVDEKPKGVVFHDPILPAKRKAKRSKVESVYVEPVVEVDEEKDSTVKVEIKPVEEHQEKPLSNGKIDKPVEAANSGPKKRRRKRKKTAESLVPVETPGDEHKLEQKGDEVSDPKTDNLQNDDGNAVASPDEPHKNPVANSPRNATPEPENHDLSPREATPQEPPPSIETPKKQTGTTKAPSATEETMTPPPPSKGPDKHSPISTTGSVPYRVGLSRRANIAPLLKIVRK